jgi:hypothetical protein
MRRMNAAYSSFSTCRLGRFNVNPALTLLVLESWLAGDVLGALPTTRPGSWAFVRGEHGGALSGYLAEA